MNPTRAHLTLFTVVLLWGGSFAAIKHLLGAGLTGPDIAVARYLVAAPGFALCLHLSGGVRGFTRRDLVRLAAAGMMVVFTYHLALNVGERYTSSGTAAVIVGTAPGITLALACALGLGAVLRDARHRPGDRVRRRGDGRAARLGTGGLVRQRQGPADRARRAAGVRAVQRDHQAAAHPAQPARRQRRRIADRHGRAAAADLPRRAVHRGVAGRLGLDAGPVPGAGVHPVRLRRVDGGARPPGRLPRGRLHLPRAGVRGDRRRGRRWARRSPPGCCSAGCW